MKTFELLIDTTYVNILKELIRSDNEDGTFYHLEVLTTTKFNTHLTSIELSYKTVDRVFMFAMKLQKEHIRHYKIKID